MQAAEIMTDMTNLSDKNRAARKVPFHAGMTESNTDRFRVEVSHPDCELFCGDNLDILPLLPNGVANLIYIDPPFNTQKTQTYKRIKTEADPNGERIGFGGKSYKTEHLSALSYGDKFDDFIAFMEPRLQQAHRLLADDGSFFLHIDYREVHYCKVLLDRIFGRDNFVNEIIWVYDFGARSRTKWSTKHDNILWYAKDKEKYTFNYAAMDRIPYMAPGLVGEKKAEQGKTPTDVWWQTIVPTNGKERTGYPTQKPLAILDRIVRIHSNPGRQGVGLLCRQRHRGHRGPQSSAQMHSHRREQGCDSRYQRQN